MDRRHADGGAYFFHSAAADAFETGAVLSAGGRAVVVDATTNEGVEQVRVGYRNPPGAVPLVVACVTHAGSDDYRACRSRKVGTGTGGDSIKFFFLLHAPRGAWKHPWRCVGAAFRKIRKKRRSHRALRQLALDEDEEDAYYYYEDEDDNDDDALTIMFPEGIDWTDNVTTVPLVFASNVTIWKVDLCSHVPEGLEVVEVRDHDQQLVSIDGGGCVTTLVSGEDIVFFVRVSDAALVVNGGGGRLLRSQHQQRRVARGNHDVSFDVQVKSGGFKNGKFKKNGNFENNLVMNVPGRVKNKNKAQQKEKEKAQQGGKPAAASANGAAAAKKRGNGKP